MTLAFTRMGSAAAPAKAAAREDSSDELLIERIAQLLQQHVRSADIVCGWKPWSEFELIGKTIRAGGVTMKITKRVVRCAATEVNPETAERDIDIPEALWRKTGDTDLGIYARVVDAGKIARGDSVEILD